MIRSILSIVIYILIINIVTGQNSNLTKAQQTLNERGEVYFQFQLDEQKSIRDQLDILTRIVSIDNVDKYAVTAYANVPTAERARLGVSDALVRLSVGIEDADELIADLEQALAG